jgi:hypothetical protein
VVAASPDTLPSQNASASPEVLFALRQLHDVSSGILKRDDLATTGQRNRIIEAAGPGHLKASNKPGRVALLRRIVSIGPFTAFIAFHLGAELVERHGAEHWYSLAGHPERHPDRSLAALASDPRILA